MQPTEELYALERLNHSKTSGALIDQEFEVEKVRILNRK